MIFILKVVSQVRSVSYYGIDAKEVIVEVHFSPGIPSFNIVGLPDKTIAESKERIRNAFHSLRLALPQKKITVNLAPANMLKEGSHFDVAIAIGIMLEMDELPYEDVAGYVVLGELSLNGNINCVGGTLPASILANANGLGIVCPKDNYAEAYWSGNDRIIAATNLYDIINYFKERVPISNPKAPMAENSSSKYDLSDVKGQKLAKRALEIAAAGAHNMLMIGPPGSGKSMLAKRITSILPPLTTREILEINSIYSVAGYAKKNSIITDRPFREPHSSSSMAAMVGGGRNAKPGEITLAHNGVLFMDELPEYNTNALESLRQPLESGEIIIARVNAHIKYPANFQLIAAMNPCKCGYFGDISQSCKRAPKCAEDYKTKISGPLLDRFDLQIELSSFNIFAQPKNDEKEESSAAIASRVLKARERQIKRYQSFDNSIALNKNLDGNLLHSIVKLKEDSEQLLKNASEKFRLSMRGINRVLRVSRTIADLDNSEEVCYGHVLEAISYRMLKFSS